jgi:ribosomal protein S18 acetylase RimI-like enzyme
MDPDEADVLLALAERDFIETWSLFGRLPGASVVDEAGVLRIVTGAPDPLANAVLRTRIPLGRDSDAAIGAAIEATIARFDAADLPWTWWSLPSDVPGDIVERVARRGSSAIESAPLMVLADLDAVTPRSVAGLAVERVRDDAGIEAFLRLAEGALELTAVVGGLLRSLAGVTGLGDDAPIRHYLGRLEGEAVGIATLHLGGRVAGIYNVGTPEAFRGRGIGSALTMAALVDARASGATTAALQSSELGLGVYRRLGFVEVGTIRAVGRATDA